MFMTDLQSTLRLKARSIQFEKEGYKVSEELLHFYHKIKLLYQNITKYKDKKTNASEKIIICKEMLQFYKISHELLSLVLNEYCRDTFYASLEKMETFFIFMNKVLKLMLAFDHFKVQNPSIFGTYCESKLKEEKIYIKSIEEEEDTKICTLNLIPLPLGRLFLSYFEGPNFNLDHPIALGKTVKIHLNNEKLKRLSLYNYIAERLSLQYILIYFTALFYRITNEKPFIKSEKELIKYTEYHKMLERLQ